MRTAIKWTGIALGLVNLSEALSMLGLGPGSPAAVDFAAQAACTMRDAVYRASVQLAVAETNSGNTFAIARNLTHTGDVFSEQPTNTADPDTTPGIGMETRRVARLAFRATTTASSSRRRRWTCTSPSA